MSAPWRTVVRASLRAGRGSVLGPDTSRRTHWWALGLVCGHEAERTARYTRQANAQRGGTQHRSRRDVLPPPAQVRCAECPAASAPAEV